MSTVRRWLPFIVVLHAILWIPGIISVTHYPNGKVWGVPLFWWSTWLTVVWGALWVALAVAHIVFVIIRAIDVVAIGPNRYTESMKSLCRYMALFVWTLVNWISYQQLVDVHQDPNITRKSAEALRIIGKFPLGYLFYAGILVFVKLVIQYISGKFYERLYSESTSEQDAVVNALGILYENSQDLSHQSETRTSVFGNVASECVPSSVLRPTSSQAIVKTMLESREATLRLAQRVFHSFARPDSEYLLLEDIQNFFSTREEAVAAFTLLDRVQNGGVTIEECEESCLQLRSDQISIKNSIDDLDSMVGMLNHFFMALLSIVAGVVLAIALDVHVGTLITAAGALLVGLSWLIGGSLQEEVLKSVIFRLIKRPFDVGDMVVIDRETYTVKEILLFSTVFLDSNSTDVQMPNNLLNTSVFKTYLGALRCQKHSSLTSTTAPRSQTLTNSERR